MFSLPRYQTTNSEITVIYQNMFLRTLGFKNSDRIISTVMTSLNKFGFCAKDRRGSHEPVNKFICIKLNFATDHIRSFHPSISHYRRKHAPRRLYLPPELKRKEMYDDYILNCKNVEFRVIGYLKYLKVISSLNISFAKLSDEQCELCQEQKKYMFATILKLIKINMYN